MDSRFFESDNPQVLAKAIKKAIQEDRTSTQKAKMREGERYYEYDHDILKFRLFYFDSEGRFKEEKNRSNIKIPHAFFTELVDQKVQYLLSNPVAVETDDLEFKEHLKEYIDEDFQLLLQEALEGASKKAYEYVYFYKNEHDQKLCFQIADSLKVIAIYDDSNQLVKLIRYYDNQILKDGKTVKVTKAELWDSEKTWYFVTDQNSNYMLDGSVETNPKPHQMIADKEGNLYGKGFGFIPFFKLTNNKTEKTDLEPVKALIDDYDLMACALSNNLVDFDHPIYAVKGYPNDNLDQLVANLKTRKTVGTDAEGGIDVKTIDIPVTARKAKLEIDKEGIYKFGMGFDSSQIGDGNITNVIIKSRYSLLDLKCNKAEVRLRKLIKQLLKIIVDDINTRFGKAYKTNDLEIIITCDTMVNEKDVVEQEKIEAETQQVLIDNILNVAARLDNDTVLKQICDVLELDFEEIKTALEQQDYKVDLNQASEVIEDE